MLQTGKCNKLSKYALGNRRVNGLQTKNYFKEQNIVNDRSMHHHHQASCIIIIIITHQHREHVCVSSTKRMHYKMNLITHVHSTIKVATSSEAIVDMPFG
jgi:hypothetical protein